MFAQCQGLLCFSFCSCPVSKWVVGKKPRGDNARTSDPNSPEGYSIPKDLMLRNKSM